MRAGTGWACALAALVAAAALAQAHLAHDRPFLQPSESQREVSVEVNRTAARFDLTQEADPLRHLVRHVVDPARGLVRVEHRDPPSDAAGASFAEWRLTRIVEYRDDNDDQRLDAGDDVVRSWRLAAYAWNVTGPRSVRVGEQAGHDVAWSGALEGGPSVALDVVATGRPIQDEGASARSQDVVVYLDLLNFSRRGVGHLYAIEGSVVSRAGAALRADADAQGTYGAYVDALGDRAYLVWGAQAQLDGVEQPVAFSAGDAVEEGGNVTWPVSWSFPVFDRSARMVLVSAVEYPLPTGRPDAIPGAGSATVAAAIALAAAAGGRRLTPAR